MKTDPITLEILRNMTIAITEEMGSVLQRSSYSPNIKERMDASCALFDQRGRLIAQADHIPVHLGSMPDAINVLLEKRGTVEMTDGDQFILNDPSLGGTHLPDITLIRPVFQQKKLYGFVANKAHHADIGGMVPCSMPAMSTDIHQEGLVLPLVKLVKKGKMCSDILSIILANTRTPRERHGDLTAQIAANERGAERFSALLNKYTGEKYQLFVEDIIEYSSQLIRQKILSLPKGTYAATEQLESDPITGKPMRLACAMTIDNETLTFDFTGTDKEGPGNLNAPLAVTKSAVYYVVRCLTNPEMPTNYGSYSPISVITPEKTLLNPTHGRAVVAGNVETSQRIVDLLFSLFARVLPEKVPAQGQGTMNNLTLGGLNRDGHPFTYYETIAGGEGAYPFRAGQDAIHVHMTNTANTPIEIIEEQFPLRFIEYSIRQGSGGTGKYNGGNGVVRHIKVLTDNISAGIISERRELCPQGRENGNPGKRGLNLATVNDEEIQLPSKTTIILNRGDTLRIETPGGGGFGSEKEILDHI